MTVEGHSDVVIVGAGPSGCAAGIVLARAGWHVTVIDAASFPRDKVCGDALSTDAVELLKQLGAAAAIHGRPHARYARAAAVFPDGTRIERKHTQPGYIVPRRDLDHGLVQALEMSGARLLQGTRVSELLHDQHGVSGVRGPAVHWTASLVLTTDGYTSFAGKRLGSKRADQGARIAVSATSYYRDVTFPHGADVTEHYFERELDHGYAWIFPAVDGISNVGVYLRANAYRKQLRTLPELLGDFLARHAERFERATRIGEVRSWPLPLAPRGAPLSEPGLLLAGDAAGLVDPLSGEGIWQALYSGKLAGQVACESLRAGGLDATLRERYDRECRRYMGRRSQRRLWIQEVMHWVMRANLFRLPVTRSLLRWGYCHPLFEG